MRLYFLFLCALLGFGANVRADNFVVDRTDDATVSTCSALADDCTLRGAIIAANATAGSDSINFNTTVFAAPRKTITLGGTQLPTITDVTTITGPVTGVNISANNTSRIFAISNGTSSGPTVSLFGLTLNNGNGGGPVGNGYGGAIYNDHGTLTVTNCTISNNSANGNEVNGGGGAGIYNNGANSGSATLTVNYCTISSNSSKGNGGGITNDGGFGSATLTVMGSTISGNIASNNGTNTSFGRWGGGIFNDGRHGGSGTLTLTNSTVSGNYAGDHAGAIGNGGNGGSVVATIASATIAGNTSGLGGNGFYNDADEGAASLTFDNTILSNGNGGSQHNIFNTNGGSAISNGYNISSDDAGAVLNRSNDHNSTDPLLDPAGLQNNGGPTQTIALLFNSPALDAGNTSLTTDQRAVARPKGFADDIGAYEFNNYAESLIVTTAADENDLTSDPRFGNGTSLREAINNANMRGSGTDVITFAPTVTGTINLNSALPDISGETWINGPGPQKITVQRSTAPATPAFRIFNIPFGWGQGPQVTISGLTIANGIASDYGGGVFTINSRLTLNNCVFVNNSAEQGGGVAVIGDFPKLSVSDCTFKNNSAINGGGLLSEAVECNVTRCTFNSNQASLRGGGFFSLSINEASISNSTFFGNTAAGSGGFGGGAIYFSHGTLYLESSTLTGNSAGDSGGGINNSIFPGSIVMRNCLIAGNSAATGPDIAGPINSQGHNLIGATDGSTGFPSTGDLTGVSDAKLGPLANNGGLTPTIALLPGSPAINKGDTAQTIDQRGIARPQGNADDIGAYELRLGLSVNDVSITEGNPLPNGGYSTKNATFTVTLAASSIKTVTVQYATGNPGSVPATAGVDYVAVPPTTLTFAPGETSKQITVPVIGDTLDEIDERFLLKLSNATNASITDSEGFCTIVDDDAAPNLRINDVTVAEGNSGTTPAQFTVTLSAPSSKTVTVQYQTNTPGSNAANAGADYLAVPPTTLTFAPGETSKNVTVLVNGDTLDEDFERFTVNLKSAGNATIADGEGFGTITDDDTAPSLSINDVTLAEGNNGTTAFTFTVTLSAPSGKAVKVSYQTDNPGSLAATAGVDYTAVPLTTLTFAPGETTKTVTVLVNGDTTVEGSERFLVKLSTPVNATISDSEGFGTITNDDATSLLFEQDTPSQ